MQNLTETLAIDYPLTKHKTGYYCKRVNGRMFYFGKRGGDAWAALKDYEFKLPYLLAGVTPPKQEGATTLLEALDRFLDWKRQRVEQGELTERSWGDYQRQCQAILAVLGKTRAVSSLISSDFDRLRVSFKGAPKTVEGLVTRSKVAFKWIEKTYDLRFNYSNLVRPSAKKIRQHRNEQGVKLFTPAELKLLIEGASPKLKAMILLGINCGLGNEDCATLKIESIVDGWHNHPRPKTGVLRRAHLWSETLSALAAVVGDRKTGLLFQTRCGNSWSSDTPSSAISGEFRKLAIKVGVKRTFYDLRRTFQTIGDDSLDPVAVKAIMGHVGTSMSDVYRQLVPDDRLQRVSEVVRNWFKGA